MAVYDPEGSVVLMHNRRGVRIEFMMGRNGALELWISPSARTSRDYRMRNFSCRDDYTRLFDGIAFPELNETDFVRCAYDAFHSVLHFRKRVVHVATAFDRPLVAVWSDGPLIMDLKSDKADVCVVRGPRLFEVKHPDRGLTLAFACALGRASRFQHQRVPDAGRSTFARAELAAGDMAVFAGERAPHKVGVCATRAATGGAARFLRECEQGVGRAAAAGRLVTADRKLNALLETNRRVLLAMQDEGGAIRAALNRIYYLIWVRDGDMTNAMLAASGMVQPLLDWTRFLYANPTVVRGETPRGKTFLQLVNPITKWEEDGIFYAIHSLFTAWTQTGDDAWIAPRWVSAARGAMTWLERYTFDRRLGLFGRYYYCESPLPGSRDDGGDAAVGKLGGPSRMRYEGRVIRRSFDIYINLFSYAAYVMLAAMDARFAATHLRKAERLARRMETFFKGDALPSYGLLRDDRGGLLRAKPYGLDPTDYQWSLSVPPFLPDYVPEGVLRERLAKDLLAKPEGCFFAAYFSVLASLDPLDVGEGFLLQAIRSAARSWYRAGKHLPMPGAVTEKFDVADERDIRPQAFSIGPLLATVAGLGLRRLPFGLAVRPSAFLRRIENYAFRDAAITARFEGRGGVREVRLNGCAIEHSLQVPNEALRVGANDLRVRLSARVAPAAPCLIDSTVELRRIEQAHGTIRYCVRGYGRNRLRLCGVDANDVAVCDARGRKVRRTAVFRGGGVSVSFAGRGSFIVTAAACPSEVGVRV